MDLYQTLGVHGLSSPEEIKAAYRQMSKLYHPDSGKGADPERFDQITKAYDVLIHPGRRARYDETGKYEDEQDPVEVGARQQFFAMCEELFFKSAGINFAENLAQFRKQSQAHLDKQRADNDLVRTKAEAARERVLKSPTENDLLGGLIKQKTEECDRAEKNLDQAQAIFDRAYELWDEYQIDDSKAPARPIMYMQVGMFGNGATTATGGF